MSKPLSHYVHVINQNVKPVIMTHYVSPLSTYITSAETKHIVLNNMRIKCKQWKYMPRSCKLMCS